MHKPFGCSLQRFIKSCKSGYSVIRGYRQLHSNAFLKFCIKIVDGSSIDEAGNSQPQRNLLLTQNTAKDTGVKKKILVAVLEDLPENHSNIQQIWSLINLNAQKLIVACNMKVANIICGL